MSATKEKKTPKGSSSSPSANSTRTVSPKTTSKPAAKTLFNYFTKISKDKAENDLNESNRKRKLSSELNQQPPVKILKPSDETLVPDDNSKPAITEPIDIDDDNSCENILPNPVEEKKPLLIKLTPINRKKKEAKTKNAKRKSINAKSEASQTPSMDVDDVAVVEPTEEEIKIIVDEKSGNKEQSKSEAKAVDTFTIEKITKDESALEKVENIEIGAKIDKIDKINDKEEMPDPPNGDANTIRRKSTRIENSQEKATMENQNTAEALKKPETKPKKSTTRKSTAEVSSKVEKEDITKPGNGSDDKAETHDNCPENGTESIISDNNSDGGLSSVISPETNKTKLPHNLNTSVEKKLTEKQIKYHEMRRKAREEREKKIQEEREKRQKEREDQRKKEREEKELKLKKEREEKEEQRKKEKAEKDEQRAKELEQKNEEKRKRDEEKRKRDEDRKKKEAEKEEEKREKEQERLKKEQEKLEEEQKKKREADKFKRFFRNSVDQTNPTAANKDGGSISISSSQGNESSNPATEVSSKFMPFCVKGNMKLAPCTRKILTYTQKVELEKILEGETSENQNSYLKQLKSQKYVIGISEKTIPNYEDDDVMILDDELDTIGDEVVELKSKHQKYRAKFLLFHGNRRPPYYGTWRKKSTIVKPCKPFEMDTKYFNYEVDSDDEWEEDEPGESLKGSDDDYESNDDYEVDNEFFVPHGYLSDEENKAEMDGEGEGAETEENDNHPSTQKAKLKILQQEFFAEHSKKTEKIKPKLIGCIWQNLNEDDDDKYPAIIHKLLENHTMIMDAAIILKPEIIPSEDNQTETSPTSIEFTNEEIQELIKLVHGNVHKRQFLVEEYLASRAEKLEVGKKEKLSKTKISNKIREIAAWKRCVTDNTVMNNRYCWVVAANQLEEFNLTDLGVLNTWKYTLKPLRTVQTPSTAKEDSNEGTAPIVTTTTATAATTLVNSITKYTTPISKLPQSTDSSTKQIATPSTMTPATKKSPAQLKLSTVVTTTSKPTQPIKKRVNPLMSVPRGQAFSQTKKNTLMSEFLKNGKANNDNSNNNVNTDESKSKITENTLNPEAAVVDETISMDCDVIQLD